MNKQPGVRILTPEMITDDLILANNADDETVAEYDPAKTYAKGEQAVEGSLVYEAVKEVTGVLPSEGVNATPKSWIEARTVNPIAMWNGVIGDATTGNAAWAVGDGNGIQMEIRPQRVTSALSFFDLQAESVRVEAYLPGEGTVYDQTKNLRSLSGVNSYWTYWFTPVERRRDVFFDGLPAYKATIRISIQGTSEGAKCGVCVIGPTYDLGYLQYKSGGGVMSFTRVVRDEFGRLILRPGETVKTFGYQISVDEHRSDANVQKLTDLVSTRVVLIGVDFYESSQVYGIYEDFRFVYENRPFHSFAIDMVGVT